MTHIGKQKECTDRENRKPEVRIFPNNRNMEFDTKEELAKYLNEGFYPKRTGTYYFRSYRQVKCIPRDSWALFRFGDSIMGCAQVKEPAVSRDYESQELKEYEGQITFDVPSTKVFNPPLKIERLEKLTGEKYHNDDNFKTGRAYYIISKEHQNEVLKLIGVK